MAVSRGHSIVQYAGPYSSSCGYCHSGEDSSVSHGMWSKKLTVYDYQDLLDHGWRRSGCFLYKPDLKATCCTQYTIRLHAASVQLARSHRKLLKRWRRYLAGAPLPGGESTSMVGSDCASDDSSPAAHTGTDQQYPLLQHTNSPAAHGKPTVSATTQGNDPMVVEAIGAHVPGAVGMSSTAVEAAHAASGICGTPAGTDNSSSRVGGGTCAGGRNGSGGSIATTDSDPTQLELALRAALQQCVAEGCLPKLEYPPLRVQPTTARQRKRLGKSGDTVVFSSSAPLTMMAPLRKAAAAEAALTETSTAVPTATTPDRSVDGLATLARGAVLPVAQQEPQAVALQLVAVLNGSALQGAGVPRCTASAVDGHINFSVAPTQSMCEPISSVPLGQVTEAPTTAEHDGCSKAHLHGSTALADTSRAQQKMSQQHGKVGQAAQQGKKDGQRQHQHPHGRPGKRQAKGSVAQAQTPAALRSTLHANLLDSTFAELMALGQAGMQSRSGADAGAAGATAQPRSFEVRTVPSEFDQQEFELYVRYQVAQHGDDPAHLTAKNYIRFLVDSSIRPVSAAEDPCAPPCGYGCFHQQYWLEGRLIAVGVVDVLPRCLSSKYFFWDPDFKALSLGRFSALQEIAWVQRGGSTAVLPCAISRSQQGGAGSLTVPCDGVSGTPGSAPLRTDGAAASRTLLQCNVQDGSGASGTGHGGQGSSGTLAGGGPDGMTGGASRAGMLQYYYMGFYIHSCAKMRYKAEFAPSELLCPATKAWVRITPQVLAALSASKYVELSRLPGAQLSLNPAALPFSTTAQLPAAAEAALRAAASPTGSAGGQGTDAVGTGETGPGVVVGRRAATGSQVTVETRAPAVGPGSAGTPVAGGSSCAAGSRGKDCAGHDASVSAAAAAGKSHAGLAEVTAAAGCTVQPVMTAERQSQLVDGVKLLVMGKVLSWKDACACGVVPQRFWGQVRGQLEAWVDLVGETARTLVYSV